MFLERSSSLPKLDRDGLLSTEDLSSSGKYLTFINNYSISLDNVADSIPWPDQYKTVEGTVCAL